MIGGLFGRLNKMSETDGLSPIQRFGAGLDALILPEMRMGQQIRQQGAQQLASLRRNSTIQELEKRANAGDAVAQRYLQGIQSGAIDPKSGFSGYLNEIAANERLQREINARAALAKAKPPTISGVEREFNFYKSRGMTDDQAMALATRTKGGTSIEVNTGEASGLRKELQGDMSKQIVKWNEAGQQAEMQLADLSALQSLIAGTPDDKIRGYLAQQFPSLQNDATQVTRAIIDRLAPQLRVEGSGSTSDREFEGMLRGYGQMTVSQEGRAAIYDIFQKRAEFMVNRKRLIDAFLANPDMTEPQFYESMKALQVEEANLSALMNSAANEYGFKLIGGGTTSSGVGFKILPDGK